MKKMKELHRHRDPPHQKQHRSSSEETKLGHDTVHQKPYLLQLPDNTIFDIHCRIPIKTLIQCRRVCKPWRSLLSDPLFTKNLFARTPPCHLVKTSSGTYFLLDVNDPNGVTALKTRFRSSRDSFVGSCNGFLCLYKKQHYSQGFVISNPITGECLALPKPMKPEDSPPIFHGSSAAITKNLAFLESLLPKSAAITHKDLAFLESLRPKSALEIVYKSCSAFGFGFSPVSDVYKVVLFTSSTLIEAITSRQFGFRRGPEKVTVLTVGSGNWRHIGESAMWEFDNRSGIYLNGYIHWIGWMTLCSSRFLYAFDIESECFQKMPLPPWTVDKRTDFNLGVLNGCLSITVHSSCNISVWVMKDYSNKESWAKELDIRVGYGAGSDSSTQALNFSKERQLLLLQNRLQAMIPGRKDLVGVEVNGMTPSIRVSHLYLPSFVSLKDAFGDQNLKDTGVQKKAETTHRAEPVEASASQLTGNHASSFIPQPFKI